MSHEPPVPPGNQSPFPIQEPPHAHAADPAIAPVIVAAVPPAPDPTPASAAAPAPSPKSDSSRRHERGLPLGTIVSAAAGVGAIAFGMAALLFPGKAKAGKKKGARRKR